MKNLSIFSSDSTASYRVRTSNVITFLLVLLVAFIAMEGLNRHFIKLYARDFITIEQFEKSNVEDIEILFLGDSHFFNRVIKAEEYERTVFSLSIGGNHYIQAYYMLRHYLHDLKSLEYLILPVDLHSFVSSRITQFKRPFFVNKYIDYNELQKQSSIDLSGNRLNIFTLLDRHYGKNNFILNLKRFLLNHNDTEHRRSMSFVSRNLKKYRKFNLLDKIHDQYSPSNKLQETNQAFQKWSESDVLDKRFDKYNVFDPELILYFKKILKLCADNGIKVITVHTPVSKGYAERTSPHITKEMLFSRILEDPEIKGEVKAHLDYENIYHSDDSMLGRIGDHLSNKGTFEFAPRLRKDLIEIINDIESGRSHNGTSE